MAMTDKVCFDRLLPAELSRPHVGRMMSLSVGPSRAAFQIAKLGRTVPTFAFGLSAGLRNNRISSGSIPLNGPSMRT
jgi:hypothetical protein